MLEKLFNKRRGIFLIVATLLTAGIVTLSFLPIKLYPTMKKPMVFLNIPHPGYTAADFKDLCSQQIEGQIKLIKDVDTVQSTYGSNRSNFRIEFKWNVSFDEAKMRVQSAIDAIKSSLPEEAQNYFVGYFQSDTSYLTVGVYSDKIPQSELYQLVKPVINTEMSKITEADSVEIINVEDLFAKVTLNPSALFSYGLTVDQAINSIKAGYKNISIGTFTDKNTQFNLRVKRGIDTLFDIENIVVSYTGSKRILLKDIANVDVRYGLPRTAFRINSKKSIIIFVMPKVDGNLKKLSSDVSDVLKNVKKQLPESVKFEFVIDPAIFIDRAIKNVIEAALIGSFLSLLVIMLLMGEVKNSMIIFMSIPTSVIFSFILMHFFGVTINIISLGGITLAVGMIVDDSIVVIENIDRHRINALKSGKEVKFTEVIITSVNEIRGAVIGSTITRVCVFLPLSFTSPLAYGILGDLAKTVIFTLLCSLVVALFFIPLLSFYIFRRKDGTISEFKESFFHKFSDKIVRTVVDGYKSILKRLLDSKTLSYCFISFAFLLLIFLALFIAPKITKEIVASPRSDSIAVSFENSLTDDQDILFEKIAPFEKDFLTNYNGKIKRVFTRVNRNNRGSFIITLVSSNYLYSVIEEIKKKYTSNNEWTFEVSSWDPSSLPLPMSLDLQIRVNGPERMKIFAIEEEIVDKIKKEDLYRDVMASPSTRTTKEIVLKPRINVLNEIPEYSINRLATMLKALLNGTRIVSLIVDDKIIDVNLNYPDKSVTSIEDVQNYPVYINDKSIPVKHFFDFEKTDGVNQIRFDNGVETYNIYAFMKRETPSYMRTSLENKVRDIVAKVKLPDGYTVSFMDTQTVVNDAVSSLIIAIIASIILIYIVLGIEFNSLKIPLIILITIPLGLIGVIGCLYVFRSTISLNSLLGIILLGGTVVSNAIIMIDFYLKKQDTAVIGNPDMLKDTIIDVAGLRFRPIVITSLTAILGMLPIAFAIGDGANIIQPLGITVSGGLAVSTFFTLFMIPCILNLVKLKK